MIVKISKKIYNMCVRFADKRLKDSKSCYYYRGERNVDKMREDIIIGTMGEWAVEAHLSSMGYYCSEPDMKIYDKRRKSFEADLYVDEIEVHVKSQGLESSKKYGHSWLLQKSDKIVTNPRDNEIFAFTCVEHEERIVDVLGYCWAKDMQYGECKVPWYRSTKVAIYLQDVEDLIVEF